MTRAETVVVVDGDWLVYRATCVSSGKSYIGITNKDESLRWWFHCRDARTRRRDGHFHQAIRKHGASAFVREILYVATSRREAIACERGLIAQYGTLSPNGYNLSSGGETYKGGNYKGRTVPESHKEHLRRLAAAMKGKKRDRDSVEKGRAKLIGHHVSQETRRKISEANKGRKPPALAAIRTREVLLGKVRSDDARSKISAGASASWNDPVRKSARLAKTKLARLMSAGSWA